MPPPCPGTETLAAFKENTLTPDEKAQIEMHFADCDRCRRMIALAIRSQLAVPHPRATDDEEGNA